MLNSDEFYIIECILHYGNTKTGYNRYLGHEGDKPCVVYDEKLEHINRYDNEKDAIDDLRRILNIELLDDSSVHDLINMMLVRNSNRYHVVKCKIEDNKLIEISKSNIAEFDRHW